MSSVLRDYQLEAKRRIYELLSQGSTRVLLQLPTGGGKTEIAAHIARDFIVKGKRVAFIAPRKLLINQTVSRFWGEGIRDIGVIQADHELTNPSAMMQVCSMQTLIRRISKPVIGLAIVDEAHIMFGEGLRWIDGLECPAIGLSATPWSKGLGKHFTDLVVGAKLVDLIEQKYLVPLRAFGPSHPDLSNVGTVAGDYNQGQLATAMNKPKLVADCINTWLDKGENRRTLVFAVDCAHARALQAQFQSAGVCAGCMDAYTPDDERETIRQQLESRELQVVCNVTVLTTGIDWPFVDCISLARPTKSEMLLVQIVGRGLRTAHEKQDCILLDHSDSSERLGLVTDIHYENLDDGRERQSSTRDRSPPLPKPCPACAFLKPPRVHKCPNCGFAPQRQSDVVHAEGELVELNARRLADRAERQRWYSGVLWIARERDYREGWAAYKFREKFGEWPNGLAKVVSKPDRDILNWEHSRRIAWAKAQEKSRSRA